MDALVAYMSGLSLNPSPGMVPKVHVYPASQKEEMMEYFQSEQTAGRIIDFSVRDVYQILRDDGACVRIVELPPVSGIFKLSVVFIVKTPAG